MSGSSISSLPTNYEFAQRPYNGPPREEKVKHWLFSSSVVDESVTQKCIPVEETEEYKMQVRIKEAREPLKKLPSDILRKQFKQWEQEKDDLEDGLIDIDEHHRDCRLEELEIKLEAANPLVNGHFLRLSKDIIAEIFMWVHAMSPPDSDRIDKNIFPWNVALTCTLTRRVAFKIPRFWTTLRIDLDNLREFEYVRMAINSSRNSDLHLTIEFRSYYNADYMQRFVKMMAPSKPRWKSLELIMNQAPIEDLALDSGVYTRLEELTIMMVFKQDLPGYRKVNYYDVESFKSSLLPALKRVDFHGIEEPAVYDDFVDFPPLAQLESLNVEYGFFHRDTPIVADSLRNLQQLMIWSPTDREWCTPVLATKIVLPALTYLEIIEWEPTDREDNMTNSVMQSFDLPVLDTLTLAFLGSSEARSSRTYFPASHPDLHRVKQLRIESWWSGSTRFRWSSARRNLLRLRDFLDLTTGVEELYLEGMDVNRPDVVRVFDRTDVDPEWEPDFARGTRLPKLRRLEFNQNEYDLDDFDAMDQKGEEERVLQGKWLEDVAESRSMTVSVQRERRDNEEKGSKDGIIIPECWEKIASTLL